MCIKAAIHSFGVDAVITRTCNNYGPRQHVEKLIPRILHLASTDQPVTIYNDGLAVREWIHVMDNCIGIDKVLRFGKTGEVYNIGSGTEHTNIDIVKMILKHINKPESLIKYTQDRINDDRRYALDTAKIQSELNWRPQVSFEDGLASTIEWYKENKKWTK